MLKLKGIKRNNGIISAEYEPECSGSVGVVAISVTTGETIEQTPSKDDNFGIYLNHALDALKKLKGVHELPSEKLVMWY